MNQSLESFGDCEIRTIAFDHPNIMIKLFDSTNVEFYVLLFSDISFMRMDCDYSQVVLDKLVVYDNIAEAKSDQFARDVCDRLKIDMSAPELGNRKISILAGIVGGDLVIASANVVNKKD